MCILSKYAESNQYDYFQNKLEDDFSKQHNYADSLVRDEFDYIFSIDADELPNKWLIEKFILFLNVKKKF